VKTAYLGGTRGSQSSIYRPGTGWSQVDRRISLRRCPPDSMKHSGICLQPMTISQKRRPGIGAKLLIVTTVVLVALLLAVVLGSGLRF